VHDSFTMPRSDYALIVKLKNRALLIKRPVRKSELLRAGLRQLQGLTESALYAALSALPPSKPRPDKKAH